MVSKGFKDRSMILTLSIITFIATFALFLGLATSILGLQSTVQDLKATKNVLTDSAVGGLIKLLARMNHGPFLSEQCDAIEHKLVQAGRLGGKITGAQYLAAVELGGITAFILVLALTMLLGGNAITGILAGIMFAVVCMWLIVAYLGNLLTARRIQLTRRLPYFLDLSVMAMEAGSSFNDSVEIYLKDAEPGNPVAEELKITLGEISMGKTMRVAFENMNTRVNAEDVQHFIKALLQGHHMGTPLGEIVRDQSQAMRFKRSQLAERAAEELKVKISGPVILMMISILLLIMGPAFVKVSQSGIF